MGDSAHENKNAGSAASPKTFLMMSEPTVSFWARDRPWPTAIGHVFLAEAVHKIGRALHGEQWRDYDPLLPISTTAFIRGRGDDLQRQLLLTKANDQRARHKLKLINRGVDVTDDDMRAGTARMAAVKGTIAAYAALGTLHTATRPIAGGGCKPLDPMSWQTERLTERFYVCQINPRRPFDTGIAGDSFEFIFVTEQSLEAAIKEVVSAQQAPDTSSLTGAKGRPSAVTDKILPEMRTRVIQMKSGAMPIPVKKIEFATSLCEWLPIAYPGSPHLTPKALRDTAVFKDFWSQEIAPLQCPSTDAEQSTPENRPGR